jgi:betaine-aldehyde dehydrogenase
MTRLEFDPETAGHYINGRPFHSGTVAESINPADDLPLGTYYDANLAVAQAAIAAARSAFDSTVWRRDQLLRAHVLDEMAVAVESNFDVLVEALMLENGKIRSEAGFEVSMCAPKLRYFAAQARTDLGHAARMSDGFVSMLLKEPVGVAGVITPWNSPVILAIRSLAPALAAGCAVVVKMPAQTALTNALLAKLLTQVPSIPGGILNFFTESGNDGAKELISSPLVDVISYTGSTAVGAKIASAAGQHLKRVSLELGGKTPMIVFDDAPLDSAIPTLTAAVTTFAGQFCMTGSRILVQAGVQEEVRERLRKSFESVNVAPASNPASNMGPMIDKAAVQRVDNLLSAAENVEVIVRGGPVEGPGAFFRPALIGVQDLSSSLIQQEIFGPVGTFETFGDETEAIERANATSFGLAASVWTNDGARSLRMSSAISAGTVWTNTWGQVFDQFEEGGYKSSGIGRLNGGGGLAEFQEVKHVVRSTT